MRVLVTGAGGFIGSHLVEALVANGQDVRALVQYNSRGHLGHLSKLGQAQEEADIRLGDVRDARLVLELVEGCDLIYHLAALIGIPYSYHAPSSYVATNVVGTLNVIEACRTVGVKRVIVTSTSEVYGTAKAVPMTEEHVLQAQSPYAATKIAADKIAESYHRSFGVPVVVLRPFNTYGPRQSGRAVIPAVLSQVLAGKSRIEVGNLEPRRDLTFVKDTVRAFVLAGEAPGIEGEVIHFGQGSALSVAEIARKCLEIVKSNAVIVSQAERRRPDKSEVGLLLCDAAKAKRLLKWQPRVSLDEGLAETASYISAHARYYAATRYAV
jgi:NAD dependent epimerase/dehydratase